MARGCEKFGLRAKCTGGVFSCRVLRGVGLKNILIPQCAGKIEKLNYVRDEMRGWSYLAVIYLSNYWREPSNATYLIM